MAQTAVNIIIENFNLLSDNDFKTWFLNSMEKLEAMETEHIMEAFEDGDCNGTFETINAEQYYKETYGN